jgi:hypothetical protein
MKAHGAKTKSLTKNFLENLLNLVEHSVMIDYNQSTLDQTNLVLWGISGTFHRNSNGTTNLMGLWKLCCDPGKMTTECTRTTMQSFAVLLKICPN